MDGRTGGLMLDWDDLRYFMALADSGSLAAAARKLGVEHATVARRVAALEDRLGTALVDRRTRRTQLTEAGRKVASRTRAMEDEAFAIERDLLGNGPEAAIELAVSAPPQLAVLVARRLVAFQSVQPTLRLTLLGQTRNVSLQRREADIALRLFRPQDDGLIIRKVGTLCYRLYGSSAYLSAHRQSDRDFIGFDEGLDDLPQQVWLKAQMGDKPMVLRSNDLGVQAEAAAAGIGLAVLPAFAAKAHQLKAADPKAPVFMRDIWLTFHRDLQKNAAVKATAAFLATCMPQETG
ncbi:LysR family transcriptional regulator [Dongia rigui]|uniref:LysR family transcriptional regulator n=1 Tax=Dongia rigui TaxID=940149 RepID=A0ABU5DW38_9PROT|nr:LysR family transcriptional regulator [Dongia rigui]MDY0871512.1 LysR family transcriptional regulator [Dongia rigui]